MQGGAAPSLHPDAAMSDEAYAQDLAPFADSLDRWLAPDVLYSQGTTVDPGAPYPILSPSPGSFRSTSADSAVPDKLRFVQSSVWDKEKDYTTDPPTCMRYTVLWKVKFNNRIVSKDTEQDIVLSPASYWSIILQPKLESLLSRKTSGNKRMRPDDSNVVVSVTERSERDLIRRLDDADVDWSVVEKQLLDWGELFRVGKKLRVEVSFNYVEITAPAASAARGGSTTQRMLAERSERLGAEADASGRPSVWSEVYKLMRCPGGSSCGPYCWRDPDSKKHYTLRPHHMKTLVRHLEEGEHLESHGDVPESLRQQLYMEDQERIRRQQKTTIANGSGLPPINIHNYLPRNAAHGVGEINGDSTGSASPSIRAWKTLGLPGFRDTAVKEYSEWHQSQVSDATLKADFIKARNVALADALDLDVIYRERDPEYFVQQGVKRGTAHRFVHDIEGWVKRRKGESSDSSPR